MKKKKTAAKASITGVPIIAFEDARAWGTWLAKNPASPSGVWMRIARKGSESKSVTYAEALEVALCYGWIDAQKSAESKDAWLQRFMPRRPRSIWSKINRGKALALIASGQMTPAGLAEIERAKQDGRWDAAYDSPRNAAVHPELQQALNENPRANAFFKTLNGANRYAILWRVQTAKTPETRTKRIRTFIEMLEKGETLH